MLFQLKDLGIGLLEEVWQYLCFKTVSNLLSVSKDIRKLCIEINRRIPQSITFTNLKQEYGVGCYCHISEQTKFKYFEKMMTIFPLISCLSLRSSLIYRYCNFSLLALYTNLNLQTTIEELHVTVTRNDGLNGISNLINLTTLDLSYSYKLTLDGFQHLCGLINLVDLNLSHCLRLSSDIILLLGTRLLFLERLNIKYTNIGIRTLRSLVYFKNLTHLNITRCRGVNDIAILALASSVPYLLSLHIGETFVTDVGLSLIADHLHYLEDLSIKGLKKITEDGLQHLLRLDYLTLLDIRNTGQSITFEPDTIFYKLTREKEVHLLY